MQDDYDPNFEWSEEASDPDAPMTLLWGGVGVALTIAVTIWVVSIFWDQWDKEVQEKSGMLKPAQLSEYRLEQTESLGSYAWTDSGRTVVIPIEKAMELTVEELAKPSG